MDNDIQDRLIETGENMKRVGEKIDKHIERLQHWDRDVEREVRQEVNEDRRKQLQRIEEFLCVAEVQQAKEEPMGGADTAEVKRLRAEAERLRDLLGMTPMDMAVKLHHTEPRTGPVIEFKDEADAAVYLQEWRHRLFLDDWIIVVHLVPSQEIEELQGQNLFTMEHHASTIRLAIPGGDLKDRLVRFSHEKTIVHELLHLKYNWIRCDGSYEGKFVDTQEHVLLEQMARSLICAKYGLQPEWFING